MAEEIETDDQVVDKDPAGILSSPKKNDAKNIHDPAGILSASPIKKKEESKPTPIGSIPGGQGSNTGSTPSQDIEAPFSHDLGYVKTPTFADQLTTSWNNDTVKTQEQLDSLNKAIAVRQKNMQDSLHGYAASGNANANTIVSLANTAKQSTKQPESSAVDYAVNHAFLPVYRSVVGGVNTAGAAVIDFISDLADKATSNDPISPSSIITNNIIHPVRDYFNQSAHDSRNIAPVGPTQGNDGIVGEIIGDTFGAAGTVGAAMLVPQTAPEALLGASAAEVPVLSNAALAGEKSIIARTALKTVTAPIVKLFAAQGFTEGYNESSIAGNGLGANILAGTDKGLEKGYEGVKMEMQMGIGGSFTNKIANSLAQKGLLIGGKPTVALINATMLGTVFGGTSIGGNIMAGEPLDYNSAIRQGVTGAMFGLPEVAGEIRSGIKENKKSNENIAKVGLMAKNIQDLNNQAVINNLMGFPIEEIHQINKNPQTSDELYTQSLEIGAQAYNEKNPQEKQKLQLQQLSLKNQADVKKATETIIKDPNGFIDGVFQSDLPVNEKVDMMNKATVINKGFNPIELHKEAITSQINDLDGKIKLVDAQQATNQHTQSAQDKVDAFTVKDDLVQQREVLALNLLDISAKQSDGLSPSTAVGIIESKRQAELEKVGSLNHNIVENTAEGTHDVVANGEILSQHPTTEDAHQRAEDLNRPQIRQIDEIHDKYNKQRAPFDEAARTGLIEPPTGKKVTDNIPPVVEPQKVFEFNTKEGKIKVEAANENELLITDPVEGAQKYSIQDAEEIFGIKPEDIQKIAKDYVEQEKVSSDDGSVNNADNISEPAAGISNRSEPARDTEINKGGENSPNGEIPSEAAAKQNEEQVPNESAATEGTGEKTPVEENAAKSSPPAETVSSTENGEIKTNETQGNQEGLLKEEPAQEQASEPVKATGEELDTPLLKDSEYKLAATEIPSGKNQGKYGIFETGSGKLISNLYDTHEELMSNFEKNKDRLTPEVIKSKITSQNISEGISKLQSKRTGMHYEGLLGLSITAWNGTLEIIKKSIEAGFKLHEAIQHGINHIKQHFTTKASDKEIEDAVRNVLLQKPTRNEGEGLHTFANRVLAWKKGISNNEDLSSAYKREASRAAKPETQFNKRVKSGVDLLRKNIEIPLEEFNKSLGLPEKDIEHYIASIKEIQEGDSIKKINAGKILDSLRQKNPKKIFGTEVSLLKRSLTEREKASGEGYRLAKAEAKQTGLEYAAAKETETKEKIAELKAKHEMALEKEKQARVDQKEKLTTDYKNIRGQIHDILAGLNKSKLLGGVDYSSRDLLSFANKLNGVITEKGIDRFRDYVNKAIDNADYSRDVTGAKGAIGKAKDLLKQYYVPQNIKSLLKDITTLNPERVEDVKELRGILENTNESLTKGTVPESTESDLVNYIQRQREFDTQTRRGDILDKHQNITAQDEFNTHAKNGNTNFVHKDTLADITNKIIKDDATTYNEKIKKLNEVDDALDLYRKDLNNSIDDNGNVVGTPENFLNVLDKVKEGTETEPTESHRDTLENVAIAKQDQIDTTSPDLSPEQKQSLEILKNVPLKGQDANTLRLFNNVVENVVDNDNHSGITILEAKAVGNSEEGALKPVKYLESIGKETIRSVKGKNKALDEVRKLRSVGENISALLTRFSNNDFKFLTAVNTGTHFDQIQNGFTGADHRFQEIVAKKVEKLFKQYPDIAKNPEAIQRLSLFSFIKQYREFASPDQQNREIQKRAAIINKDISLKEKGLDLEKGEAEIEKKIWGEFAEKIKEKTGIDITDKEQLPGLKYSDIEGIEFLKEGEKKIYDTYREADDSLRPEHEQVAIGINKPYETWVNHARDNYRFLNSGLVPVTEIGNVGFQATDNAVDSASDTLTQRVKGDPLAQKSGERQKVLNLNFFDGQDQSIKNILNDIHTLKDRMTFDEAMKNKEFQDAIGNENHQFYKEAVTSYVLNEMGLNKSTGEKELKLIKKGLNVITKLGTYKQLLSMTAFVKQATATIVNTLAYTGFDVKTMYEANQLFASRVTDKYLNKAFGTPIPDYKVSDAVEELLKKHPISRRSENNASLNILSQEGIGDKNNIISPEAKGAVAHTASAISDWVNKYFLDLNSNGTTREPFITKPIKFGDVKTAEWSWVTLYGKALVDSSKYPDFKSIDWVKEAENPDREAAALAEQLTSKQLNENTKAGRSKLVNSQSIGLQAAKAVLFPFGSFNMHKGQVLAENLRTLTSKDTYVNKESFKNQGGEAIKSILSSMVEESAFQGLKIGIGLSLTPMLQKGLIYALGSLFGTQEETDKYLSAVDLKTDKKAQTALNNWFTQTVGNQAFGALGNTPQDAAQKTINYLSKQVGGDGKIFYEPTMSVNQQLSQASSAGMLSAALSGDSDRIRDLYRAFINNKNAHKVAVDMTPMQKAIIATSVLSDVLSMAGMNDADLNRAIETLRKNVDNELANKFGDQFLKDENAPRPMSIIGKKILLSEEHQDYYEQQRDAFEKKLIEQKVPKQQAAQAAAQKAKADLLQKFDYDNVIKGGKEIKNKK